MCVCVSELVSERERASKEVYADVFACVCMCRGVHTHIHTGACVCALARMCLCVP